MFGIMLGEAGTKEENSPGVLLEYKKEIGRLETTCYGSGEASKDDSGCASEDGLGGFIDLKQRPDNHT